MRRLDSQNERPFHRHRHNKNHTTRLQNAIKWCSINNDRLGYAVETAHDEVRCSVFKKEALLGLLYTAAENAVRANSTLCGLKETYPLLTVLASPTTQAAQLLKSFREVEQKSDVLAQLVYRYSAYEVLQSASSSLVAVTKRNLEFQSDVLHKEQRNEINIALQAVETRIGVPYDRGNMR